MSEQTLPEQTLSDQPHSTPRSAHPGPAARAHRSRYARTRMPFAIGATLAVLALGSTLTACGLDEPTVEKAAASTEEKTGGKQDTAAEKGEKEEKKDGPMAGGDTAVYDSGVKITVSKATPYTPGEYAAGHTEGNKAYKVTVSLENAGKEKFDAGLVMVSARAGEEGVEAERIFDSGKGMSGDLNGTLLPGKKATAVMAFDTPAAAKVLDIEVEPLDFESAPALWSLTL